MFALKVSEQIKWQQSHPESIITYAFGHEAPFKHSVLIKPFMKEVFWFERPPQAYLYWNECLTGETSSSSLQRTLQGTTTIIVFLSHRKQVWHLLPQTPTPTFLRTQLSYVTRCHISSSEGFYMFLEERQPFPASSASPCSIGNMGLLQVCLLFCSQNLPEFLLHTDLNNIFQKKCSFLGLGQMWLLAVETFFDHYVFTNSKFHQFWVFRSFLKSYQLSKVGVFRYCLTSSDIFKELQKSQFKHQLLGWFFHP